jgi:hypothetical protein
MLETTIPLCVLPRYYYRVSVLLDVRSATNVKRFVDYFVIHFGLGRGNLCLTLGRVANFKTYHCLTTFFADHSVNIYYLRNQRESCESKLSIAILRHHQHRAGVDTKFNREGIGNESY